MVVEIIKKKQIWASFKRLVSSKILGGGEGGNSYKGGPSETHFVFSVRNILRAREKLLHFSDAHNGSDVTPDKWQTRNVVYKSECKGHSQWCYIVQAKRPLKNQG